MVYDPLQESSVDVVIQVPDVSWDIARVESSETTNSPATVAAAATHTELSSKQIDVLNQINILPTYFPSPSPTTSAPMTPTPTSVVSSIIITTSFPTTIITEGTTSDKSRTFFSCPPPPRLIVRHGESIIEIDTPLSTVRISYGFHVVQTQENNDIRTILPAIEGQMEQTLGEYMKSHTEDGYDESSCSGYYIEDFRRSRRKAMAEELPTKIIALSSAEELSLDKYVPCETIMSTNCFVVKGALDASYIGHNEAGVTSSISRLIKTEVVNQAEYDIEYIDANNDESYGYTTPNTADLIPTIVSSLQETDPAMSNDESGGITNYGAGILVALGLAFIGVVYVAFIKGNKQRRTKLRERHEFSDDLSDKVNHYPNSRQKSVTPDVENNDVSSHHPRGMKWRANDCDRGSGKSNDAKAGPAVKVIKKSNQKNMSDDAIIAIPDESSNGDGSCEVSAIFKRPFHPVSKDVMRSGTAKCTTNSIDNNCDSSITRRSSNMEAELHNISDVLADEAGGDSATKKNEQWPLKLSIIPLVDRFPSSVSSNDEALGSPMSIGGRSRILFLPSISEADLSPSMKDTPSVHSPKKLSKYTSGMNRCTSHSSNYSNEYEESEI